jgi:hydroxyacylglutathione hydrolase
MLHVRQFYLACLSHASYVVGDTTSGRAVVVDPQRDIQQYLDEAATHGLTIEAVIETHFHADFLSGHLELASATGASIVFGASAEGKAQFPIRTVRDGEIISLGAVELEILETPGHTPESICVIVREHPGAEPHAVLTGDTLFIGDVGRPDLLASFGATADDLGRMLYHSLRSKLLTLPDATKVLPAHGAGSACGKHLSTETVSTIGEQRRTNHALQPMGVDDFVAMVTEGQQAAPPYFPYAAVRNREVRDPFDTTEPVAAMTLAQVLDARAAGAAIVDTRDDIEFARAHLVGSVNVGLGGRFAEYVGDVVPAATPIVLVGAEGTTAEARTRLARIGFDTVIGALIEPERTFAEHPEHVTSASRLTAMQLDERIGAVTGLQVVDVRNPGEVANGMIPGARHLQLAQLRGRMSELDPATPVVVHCAGGYRSSIAASLLRANGFADVSDLVGGFQAWTASGHPVDAPAR